MGALHRSFNSTLVQLKAPPAMALRSAPPGFNSTLVQLKAQSKDFQLRIYKVSILP